MRWAAPTSRPPAVYFWLGNGALTVSWYWMTAAI
ncbi:hypothetical protein DFR69_116138, partial [Nocardia neocaledoniensis]